MLFINLDGTNKCEKRYDVWFGMVDNLKGGSELASEADMKVVTNLYSSLNGIEPEVRWEEGRV